MHTEHICVQNDDKGIKEVKIQKKMVSPSFSEQSTNLLKKWFVFVLIS